MERLTTDKPQNNSENALNLAYAKDKWVHIRGMDESFTDYIKKGCRRNGCNLSEMSDHEVCECVTECAFSNPECPVFLLFMVATQAAELRARLSTYEDTGLLPEEIKVLQEKAQREQECEYCDFSSGNCGEILDGEDDFFLITPDNSHEFYIATDGKGVFRETKIHFCPMCGRKLDGGDT